MQDEPRGPWIHIGECPVCVNGVCRIRCCHDAAGGEHFYAVCDECQALWSEPNIDAEPAFSDPRDPQCPICGAALFGDQSHWAHSEELDGSSWKANAIWEIP